MHREAGLPRTTLILSALSPAPRATKGKNMPRAKGPTSSSDEPKPPSRRKARPKFEVAPEQVAAPAAGWVYRDESAAEPKPTAAKAPPPSAENPVNSIPMLAFGVMAV